jgi:hypothetical protein
VASFWPPWSRRLQNARRGSVAELTAASMVQDAMARLARGRHHPRGGRSIHGPGDDVLGPRPLDPVHLVLDLSQFALADENRV